VLYHDCISMDSTFGTNRFRMPLVLVVGVDGEGRTILLGSGLLSDEMSGSYEWLFEQLREAGHMLQPGVIFTDGDPVFPDAIAKAFASTRHYLCAWHLSQSMIRTAASKLGGHLPTLMDAFSRCRKIQSVAEFEQAWRSVLSMHEMAPAADYLAGLTRTKASTGGCAAAAVARVLTLRLTSALAAVTMQEKWAAAYTHDVFTGGIQSTQRNESMNAFVKSHLTGETSLEDLLGALDMVMVKEKHRAASTEREPSRLTSTPAEATARSALTRYAATHVAKELVQTGAYAAVDVTETLPCSTDASAAEARCSLVCAQHGRTSDDDAMPPCAVTHRRMQGQQRVDCSVCSACSMRQPRQPSRPGRPTETMSSSCRSCKYPRLR
jgi:hypothetical protein